MSSSINQITLLGRLGVDPNMKVVNGTAQLCLLSVATDNEYKDRNGNPQKETLWHRVAVWGPQAKACAQFLHKGDKVCVVGSLKYSEFEQNGVKQKSAEIVAREVVFLGQKQQNESAPPPQMQPAQNQQPQNNNGWGQPQPGWGQMEDVPY